MLVITSIIPGLVALGSLVDTAIADLLDFLAKLVSLSLRVVIDSSLPNNPNLSKVRVRGGPALTLSLTSKIPTPTSRDNRSSQSSLRSHNCQSILSFLSILPSQFLHTNHAGQYGQPFHQSQARNSTHSENPGHPSRRRKDKDSCHTSRTSKSSRSSQPSISVQSKKPTRSSNPRRRVFDTPQEGGLIN